MYNIKNIELLPSFFAEVSNMYGIAQLSNGKFVVAIMSDLLPGTTELKRCVRMAYESNAMLSILEIPKDSSNLQVYRNKAIDKLIDYSFMDKQIAKSIVDSLIVSIYPDAESLLTIATSSIEMVGADTKEKRILVSKIVSLLKHKLNKELEEVREVMCVYELMGITPPEDYLRIKNELL